MFSKNDEYMSCAITFCACSIGSLVESYGYEETRCMLGGKMEGYCLKQVGSEGSDASPFMHTYLSLHLIYYLVYIHLRLY